MISCTDYVESCKKSIAEAVAGMQKPPKLVVVQVGDNPASNSYIKSKATLCDEVGIDMWHICYGDGITPEELYLNIRALNDNPDVDGIIVQLPLPEAFDVQYIQNLISPEKDVDGFRVDSKFISCTPKGIMDYLTDNGVTFRGKNAVVIGRSEIVGRPLVNLLIKAGATVTCCNSATKNLAWFTKNADIVVSAVGKAKMLGPEYFSDNQIVVDVGINRDENGKLCGDVDRLAVEEAFDIFVTPVPKGVGKLTVCSLAKNTLEATKYRA